MPLQSVSTGLDGSNIDTSIRTGLTESKDAGTEEKVVVPPIGGEQIDGTLVVTPESGELDVALDETQQLAAVLTDDQGRTHTVTGDVPWSSPDDDIATVDESGLVVATGAGGPINITGSALGSSDAYACTVVDTG